MSMFFIDMKMKELVLVCPRNLFTLNEWVCGIFPVYSRCTPLLSMDFFSLK